MHNLGEWILAVCIVAVIILVLAYAGVLIAAVLVIGVLLMAVEGFLSLFRRSEATSERERGGETDVKR